MQLVVAILVSAIQCASSQESLSGWWQIRAQLASQERILRPLDLDSNTGFHNATAADLQRIWNAAIDGLLHGPLPSNTTDPWYAGYVTVLRAQFAKASTLAPVRRVGFYDSGVGGLTVWRVQQQQLPELNASFFGDDERAPYGSQDPKLVAGYVQETLGRLANSHHVGMALIACNTASIAALSHGVLTLPQFKRFAAIPIVPPYGAFFQLLGQQRSGRKVGLFATDGTCASGVYQHLIRQAPGFELLRNDVNSGLFPSQANTTDCIGCAECVAAVQRDPPFNTANDTVWDQRVESMLRAKFAAYFRQHVDYLVLGCTHFPLLEPIVQKLFPSVLFIDPATYQVEFLRRFPRAVDAYAGDSDFAVSELQGKSGDIKYATFFQVANNILLNMGFPDAKWARVLDEANATDASAQLLVV